MKTRSESVRAWRAAQRAVTATRGAVTIPKWTRIPHPRDAGALPTTTWPVGQLADYALEFEIGMTPLLIREFADRYEAFLAGAQLTAQVVRFLEENPEAARYAGAALLGTLVGAAVGKSREAALLGAGIGLLLAAVANAGKDERQVQS